MSHSLADSVDSQQNSITMSSALDKMVLVFTSSNWQQWHTTMQAYLRAQGQWFVYGTAQPADEHDLWYEHNEKALGNITLRVSPLIQTAISHLTTVKEVWDHLKENYGTPSIGNTYAELSWLLLTTIPAGSHLAPAITKMLSHFTYLKDTGFEFPANVQAMVILCKLPPTMEVVAQILSQTSPSEIKTLKPDGIVKVATLSFKQKGASHGSGGKAPQASKVSAVKCKQADPKVTQQQQQAPKPQQQQGSSNGGGSGNAPTQGQGGHHHHGSRKAHTHREHAQNAECATYVRYEDGPVPTINPCALAHTTGVTNYGPPTFNNTIKAFDLVHCLGIEPSCQTIRTLDSVISTASANLDQPKASPSSLKRPRLEERIAMDVEEDTVSLGDKDDHPFIYEDFADSNFDNVDEMILNCYNAVLINLGAEASLFRQVPSTHALLIHTDMLPLHVHYMPALYIASKYYNMSCRVPSSAYICSHEIHDARCVNCKGKMADGSEMSSTFWLLDSGTSHHFTGNLRDFTSFQELKHKHFAKTANGVAEIAGIGTILLRCLDHNIGDEKVVKLTQVLHMPGTTAHLISMGEMLLQNYRVADNRRGISLIGKANRLWFGTDPEDECGVIFGIRSIPKVRSNYITSVSKVDYDIMHWRFGHPSKEVLQCAHKHMQHFPDIHFPTEDCVCPGCALGKMPNRAFPENERCATKPFELVHSDLKSFPVLSYWKFKYIITFYDNYTSHAWTMALRSEAAAITAAKDFLEMVHVQHNAHVIAWMSDAGREYKSDLFDRALLEKGIKIYQSAPQTPMQNGHAE